jgi:hypothetical protein
MRERFFLGASALLLAFPFLGFSQSVEEYQKLMRPAAAANGKLAKSVGTDLSAAASAAADVKSHFQEIEQFWAKHKVEDAQKFAKNIQDAADEVAAAAKAGNQEQAVAAQKKIAANCGGCHNAHREKDADGKFTIKK